MTSIKDDDTTYLTTVTVLLLLHSSVFVRVALVEVVVTLVTSGSGYIGRSGNSSGVYSDNSHGTGRRIYSGCFSGISNGGGSDSSKCFSNAYTC